MSLSESYDMIVIGSGIGGLTVASLMAQLKKKRVLVLERHFKVGGFTHTFKRGKFLWDVGVHYIGEMEKKKLLRTTFDKITRGGVDWARMPEPMEKFIYPDLTFPFYGDPERFKQDLENLFPKEKENIHRYFQDCREAGNFFVQNITMPQLTQTEASLSGCSLGDFPLQTTKSYLDSRFSDEKLKGLLVSQWGDYGLPPSMSSFLIHALIVNHYLQGGYYPVGSSAALAASIQPIIEEQGGAILVNHEVEKILCEQGQALGVRVRVPANQKRAEMKELRAPVIVSDAGAYNTYLRLLKGVEIPFRSSLKEFYNRFPVSSNITLYLGLRESPEKLGIKGENYWVYSSYDHDDNFQQRNRWLEGNDLPAAFYLSFPSLKDPEAKAHTAEVITFADYDFFQAWRDQPWKKRNEAYQQLKAKLAEKMIRSVEQKLPGFSSLIEYQEVSTPLTNEHFTAHPHGSIYGVPASPERFHLEKTPWCQPCTPIKSLYLTGADACCPGVTGALMGGVLAAAQLPDAPTIQELMAP